MKYPRAFQMSTYLVAFSNGHFEYLESSYISPLSGTTRPLRIYGTYSSHVLYEIMQHYDFLSDCQQHTSSTIRPRCQG
jgi:hypothetical protein